ncbi:hypothetical protein AB0L44_38015 [Nonomuraea wenchangensis]|uniref:PIN-like domain-containing protein n=1 Tax=Nonomuraea wenchangensis TaxID=568860 RepID=UPI0034459193
MAGEARDSGLTFFLDRGLGSVIVPTALREAGWIVETMDERYGKDRSQHIPDQQWIEEATIRGDVLLCKDIEIASNPLEAQALYVSGARAFALANAALPGQEMFRRFLLHEASIVNHAKRITVPFIFAVHEDRLRRKSIRYPLKR